MTKWTEVTDPIKIEAHKTRHQDAGDDEIDLSGLTGFFHHGNIDGSDLGACLEAMDNLDRTLDGGVF